MTCRADTDRQTDTYTHKQTEIAKTEGPIDFFGHFFLDFFIDERSKKEEKKNPLKSKKEGGPGMCSIEHTNFKFFYAV